MADKTNGPYDVLVNGKGRMRRCLLPSELDVTCAVGIPPSDASSKDGAVINLTSRGGSWYIAETGYMLNLGGTDYVEGANVSLRLRELNTRVTRYAKFDISRCETVYISTRDGRTCVSESTPAARILAVIKFSDGGAEVRADADHVFLGGESARTPRPVGFRDTLYVGEVCFVFLGGIMAVNHTDTLECSLPKYEAGAGIPEAWKEPKFYDFPRSTQVRLELTPERADIEPPPTPRPHNATPFWLQAGSSLSMFAVMSLSMILRVASGSSSNQLMGIISLFTMAGSAVGMVIFPRLMRNYQEKKSKREEKERQDKYGDYLRKKDELLARHKEKDSDLLKKRYPSAGDSLKVVLGAARVLWGRTPVFQEFLDIRIGTGDRPALHYADIAAEEFTLTEDSLRKKADGVVALYQTIENAPFSVELTKHPVVGVYGHRETCLALLRSMLIQITAMHSYDDVKIILLYDADSEFMSFARWLPHMWNHDRDFRYAARTKNEVDNIFENLKPVFDEREERKERQKSQEEVFIPHYVVISLAPALLKNELLHRRFLSSYDDLRGMGVSFIVVDRDLSGMPVLSNALIDCQSGSKAYININDGRFRGMTAFTPDLLPAGPWNSGSGAKVKYWWAAPRDWPSLARHMYRIRTMDVSENSLLPHSLSFLGMYGVKSPEELQIERRWAQNDNSRRIEALVGTSATGVFNLDIHEKGHGPHGLIAGTTGSGKSEFIQTLVLSLCVNYSPDDLAFVIIDYKGGSTANIFGGLPHLAGCITNLGGNQIQRSLLSINSEMTRRQQLLANCGDASVNSIDKYNELRKLNPSLPAMPHLVLIADEFAELKREQPAFLEELVSASRIGRSLGVHLLLATQNPAGVVNDQIRGNTRFRICLKVADKASSSDMLGKPDAAEITQPGRAYMQVGVNEIYQQIQTGYSGAPYRGSAGGGTDLAEIFYVQHNGQINPNLSAREEYGDKDVSRKIPSQLEAVLEHIDGLSRDRYHQYQLWLTALPEVMYMDELRRRADFPPCVNTETGEYDSAPGVWMSPVVGLIDDVRRQEQPLLALDFAENGHLALYGVKGSGKTTFLQTLICALATQYTPRDVHMYIVDYDMGTLIGYKDQLPHVGGVVLPDDEERMKSLFNYLEKEAEERRGVMSAAGTANISLYNARAASWGRDPLPAVVVMIHNFEAFADEQEGYKEKVRELIRDSDKAGIYFVLTCGTRMALSSNIQRHVKSFICMQMTESFDYKSILNVKDGLTPEAVSGRGLIKLHGHAAEFQTAFAAERNADGQFDDAGLRGLYEKIKAAWAGPLPHGLATIPRPYIFQKSLSGREYTDLLNAGRLPLGYDKATNSLVSIRAEDVNVFPIMGGRKSGKTNMLKCLAELCGRLPNAGLYIFDSADGHLRMTADNLSAERSYAHDKEGADALARELLSVGQNRWEKENRGRYHEPVFVFIDNIVHFFETADANSVLAIDGLMSRCDKLKMYFFVSGAKIDALKGQTEIYNRMFEHNNGVLLGGNFDAYAYFKTEVRYGKERTAQFPEGTGFVFGKGVYGLMVTPEYGGGGE